MEPVTLPEETQAADPSLGLGGRAPMDDTLAQLIKRGGVWGFVGLGFLLVIIGVVAWWPTSPAQPVGTLAPLPTQPPAGASSDSLGISLSELAARWNEAAVPPTITKGIPRVPESGPFDAFSYRFNESSLVAGAYDDRTEDVYALLVSSWISDENAHRLVIHLCHVAHPYSQACLDEYFEHGLGGLTLEEYRDLGHRAEWKIDDVTWRLEIVDNIQHIRVIAPGSSG